ncbi:MAG: radical SAM protein [Patescibacteria group bacterium]|nr:radical SAM protein [Patescibacteria group bacterium]
MKLALVSYDAFQGRTTGLYPPLHLCNLATTLGAAQIETRVFDYAGPFAGIDAFFREVGEYRPDLVGLTSYTPYLGPFHKLTKELRSHVKDAVMVVGGAHPTAWPEWTLQKMPQFDYAMAGECDRAIVSLARMVGGEGSEANVPGLVFRQEGTVRVNECDVIDSLDDLPQVRREYLDEYYRRKMYWDMAGRGKLDMMITSRGCPYRCSFCFKVAPRFRCRSAPHVLEEFEMLKRRGVRSIHVQDDAFTANKRRCIDICDELIRRRYRFDLKVRSRVNSVDEELLRKMKAAGVRQIIYGFESGSQVVLDSMNKKTTVEMNRRAVDLTKKVGIACYGEIMVGMPGETPDTVNETLAFLLEKKPIVGYIPVLYPLPTTAVYERAKKDGTLMGDWDVDGSYPWVKLPWAHTRADIVAEASRLSRAAHWDPGTMWYFLKKHLRTMSWRQFLFLVRFALKRR